MGNVSQTASSVCAYFLVVMKQLTGPSKFSCHHFHGSTLGSTKRTTGERGSPTTL